MNKYYLCIVFLSCQSLPSLKARVAIGTNSPNPNPNSILAVQSAKQGFLPPRLSSTERDAKPSPVAEKTINEDTEDIFLVRGLVGG